jgi:hypothetical protein
MISSFETRPSISALAEIVLARTKSRQRDLGGRSSG